MSIVKIFNFFHLSKEFDNEGKKFFNIINKIHKMIGENLNWRIKAEFHS